MVMKLNGTYNTLPRQFTGLLFIGLMFLCLFINAENPALQGKIDSLLVGDRSVIPALVDNKEEALLLLVARIHPPDADVSSLLAQLGADTDAERTEAVNLLSNLGGAVMGLTMEFKKLHPNDPEIQLRCRQVIDNHVERAKKRDHTAIVQFLITSKVTDPEMLKKFQGSYGVVFMEKTPEIFDQWKEKDLPESFLVFAAQLMQIPELRRPFASWMLGQNNKDRQVINTLRYLLQADFENTFLAFNIRNNYHNQVDRLIWDEFGDQLTDQLIRQRVKRIYDRQDQPPTFDFDPEQPVTPLLAFQLLNLEGRATMESRYSEYFFEKMAPMSIDDLRKQIQTHPLDSHMLRGLAGRYPDLHAELKSLVLGDLEEARLYVHLLEGYSIAVKTFGVEFQEGELDELWLRFFENEKANRGHLISNGARFQISSELLLQHMQQYPEALQKQMSFYNDTFAYLMDADRADIRIQTLKLMQPAYSQQSMRPEYVHKLWNALLKNPEREQAELAAQKIAFLKKMNDDQTPRFLVHQLKREGSALLSKRLATFYRVHPELINPLLETEELTPMGIQFVCLLSEVPGLPETTTLLLQSAQIRALKQKDLSGYTRFALQIAGLNLGSTDPEAFELLLAYVVGRIDFPNLPIWFLDETHRPLLPILKQKMEAEETQRVRLLCIGLMIDPDDPSWQPQIQDILQQRKGPEVATLISSLKTIGREPDLSQLSPERQAELFENGDKALGWEVRSLLKEMQRPENIETAFRQLNPQLGTFLNYRQDNWRLRVQIAQYPASWELLGDGLLQLVENGNEVQRERAADLMTALQLVPETEANRLAELLDSPDTNIRIRNSLLWVVACMGPLAVNASETVLNLHPTDKEGKQRQSFALTAISPDPAIQDLHFENLLNFHRSYPDYKLVRMVGLLRTYDEQKRLDFFQQVLEQAFSAQLSRRGESNVREVIRQVEHLQYPENTLAVYRNLLTSLADPGPQNDEYIHICDAILGNLLSYHPDHISSFRDSVEALPFKAKQMANYRTFQIRAAAAKD